MVRTKGKKWPYLIAFLIGAGLYGLAQWADLAEENRLHPPKITIQAQAGTAAIVPYDRPFTDSKIQVLGMGEHYVKLHIEPENLPEDIEIVYSRIHFMYKYGSGYLLLWIPDTASGSIEFSVEASMLGSGIMVRSRSCDVAVEITPPVVQASQPPFLEGRWNERGENKMEWLFRADNLTEIRAGQERKFNYRILPGGNGKWFIVARSQNEPMSRTEVYWIELGSDSITVSSPDEEFKPFKTLWKED